MLSNLEIVEWEKFQSAVNRNGAICQLGELHVICRFGKQGLVIPFHYVVQKTSHAEFVLLELMEAMEL